MNGDLLAVLDYYEKERGIDRQILIEAIENAILTASKRSVGPARDLRVEFGSKSGNIKAFASLEVVAQVQNKHDEISLAKARAVKPDAKLGDDIEVEVTPTHFGRIAAQAARQAILQRIKQAEREKIFAEYSDRESDIVNGTIARFDRGDVIVDLNGAEAVLPERERVTNEDYNLRDRVRAYVLAITNSAHGPEIVLSRSHPGLVRRLFELEVSEIFDGTVEIKAIAREAGYRTKIAVVSHEEKVDPVGACVGMRGVRVKNIVRELNGEKIDIVRWNADIRAFVTEALQPARFKRMEVDEEQKRIRIIVDESQLSLAIGKRGQNARLASKLIGWRIDVEKEISPEMAFENKVKHAIQQLANTLRVSPEVADTLARAGIMTPDGLMAAEAADLEDIGLAPDVAAALVAQVQGRGELAGEAVPETPSAAEESQPPIPHEADSPAEPGEAPSSDETGAPQNAEAQEDEAQPLPPI